MSDINSERILISLKRMTDEKRKEALMTEQPPVVPDNRRSSFFDNRIALTVPEAAMALGLSTRTFERLLRNKEIPSKKVGRRVLIPTAAIEAWLTRKE